MKIHSRKIPLLLIIAFFQISVFAQSNSKLDALYRSKRFFELRDELAKHTAQNSSELLFYRGAVADKFNQSHLSIEYLHRYLKTAKEADVKLRDCYELLADDYVKTYQYRRAGETYQLLLDRFTNAMNADKKTEIESSAKLWSALRDVPAQTIAFNDADTRIQGSRDKAALLNIPVEINRQKMDFVFDTGANESTISATTARRLGLKIIEADISVGTSTDKRVNAKLAVAPAVQIGNVTVRNVVFLVLDDKSLYFPPIDYQISGIIGFPVLEAFRRIRLTRTNEITVPAKASSKPKTNQNMCLDDLTPLISVIIDNQPMTFALDTGADTSRFYPAFYTSPKAAIDKSATSKTVKLGGAGGIKETRAYIVDKISLLVSGKRAQLNKIEVLTEPINEDSRYYDGQLGQDLIKQFETMTLDFQTMNIIFQ